MMSRASGVAARDYAPTLLTLSGASGLLAVFGTSFFLTRFPYGQIVLPWNFPIWVILSFVASGAFITLAVVVRPTIFWHVLIVTSVLTAGISVLRYTIFDEWLAASCVAGFLASKLIFGFDEQRKLRSLGLWVTIFFLYLVFLVIMSIIGFLEFENLKTFRFTFTYLIIFGLGVIVISHNLPFEYKGGLTLLLGQVCMAYYLLYLLHAFIFRSFFGNSVVEGLGFAGVGSREAIGIIAVPAGLILMRRKKWPQQILGVAILALTVILAALSDSRGAFGYLLTGMAIAALASGLKFTLRLMAMAIIGAMLVGTFVIGRPQWVLDITSNIVDTLRVQGGTQTLNYHGREVTVAKKDEGRFLYAISAQNSLLDLGYPELITGVGTYGFFPAAGEEYKRLAAERNIPTTVVNYGTSIGNRIEPPRPPSLGPTIVENGLLGLFLLFGCVASALVNLVLKVSASKGLIILRGSYMLIGASIVLALESFYFGAPTDMVLFFLLITPFGLTYIWSESEHRLEGVNYEV